jgi:hypothetical protein
VSLGADIFIFSNRPWLGENQKLQLSRKLQIALLSFTSFEEWFSLIRKETRNDIRKSRKDGAKVEILDNPSPELSREILRIFRESPFREGRYFEGYHIWNEENIQSAFQTSGSILTVVAKYDGRVLGVSRILYREKNAKVMTHMISLAGRNSVRGIASAMLAADIDYLTKKGVRYLTYGKSGVISKLDQFRKHNGFELIEVDYNYLPLTLKGNEYCRLGIYEPPDILFAGKFQFALKLLEGLQPHLPLSMIRKFHLFA